MAHHTVRFLLTADVLVDVDAADIDQATETAMALAVEEVATLGTTNRPVRILATADDLRLVDDEDGA